MSLPPFGFVTVHRRPLADGIAAESGWTALAAATGRAGAHLWQGEPGLVAPRNCMALPGWEQATQGRRVAVRASGGGVVPQGPGLLNLSLTWHEATGPRFSDAIYRGLCEGIGAALARLGIAASTQAVPGSFCDGRFNLAAGGRKIVGTAQSWRRVGGRQMVLAHALVVVDADPVVLTEAVNAFERELGSGRVYRAEALTSVAAGWREAHREAPPPDLAARLTHALAETFARMIEPHEAD